MSYMSDLRSAANPAQLPTAPAGAHAPVIPAFSLNQANTRVSEALETTILVATLSGVSLVMSTIAAGAF